MYYRLSYLISYLLFRNNGVLIFKGDLNSVREMMRNIYEIIHICTAVVDESEE